MTTTAPSGEHGLRYSGRPSAMSGRDSTNLADLLERILDKGIVIAGDIVINLVDVELLTIKLRLLIASVDKAREMGVSWWESDPWLKGQSDEDRSLKSAGDAPEGSAGDAPEGIEARLRRIEQSVERIALASGDVQRGQEAR